MPGLTLEFTLYLNEIKLLKPVTCYYQLPTHSAWSHRILGSQMDLSAIKTKTIDQLDYDTSM